MKVDTYRKQEYLVLVYRLFLAYFFYFIARLLFVLFNNNHLKVDSVSSFFELTYYGLAFDTTAILYVNLLFILFSVLPLVINTTAKYQKFLFYLYFITNGIAYATNFVDIIYYRFIYSRTTTTVLNVLENESNKTTLFFKFIASYWYVYLLFFLVLFLWIYLYKRVKVTEVNKPKNIIRYIAFSILMFLFIATMAVGGIRGGDFRKSTRPINLVDASKHVEKIQHADLVLNTPFSIIRTIGKNTFKKVKFEVADNSLEKYIKPIKQYSNNEKTTPNIMLFIVESFGREYLGAFNKHSGIKDYVSYTPFLDSLANHGLVFSNAYCNGSKSIHAMSSVISGIPSFKTAYTSSPYSNQKAESLVSTLESIGYNTSFFHGSHNGSMGFLGFSKVLGFDDYYGKTEYNNDDDFDGFWGIWDEPFMQFMKKTLDTKKEPFLSTIFTVSSHDPFIIPKKYEGKFPKGHIPMHQCVGYTDYAFKRFFEAAKKEPWFKNTIFVITADHPNQIYYDEPYAKLINRRAVPILFYKPDGSLKGEDRSIAQQIDIYPTILDIIGYNKPFRSWGRSLVCKDNVKPFAINYDALHYQFLTGNYICTFDGEKATGFYNINDKGLEHNLIDSRNEEMNQAEDACKAFIKDYYDRIIDKKLFVNNENK